MYDRDMQGQISSDQRDIVDFGLVQIPHLYVHSDEAVVDMLECVVGYRRRWHQFDFRRRTVLLLLVSTWTYDGKCYYTLFWNLAALS
jgi:hypothetical protein